MAEENSTPNTSALDGALAELETLKASATTNNNAIKLFLTEAAKTSHRLKEIAETSEQQHEEIAKILSVIQGLATTADEKEKECTSHAAAALERATATEETRTQAFTHLQAIQLDKQTSEVSSKQLATLAGKAADSEKTIDGLEREIDRLIKECDAQLKTIVGLLPGATSAGLAHSFDARGKLFTAPATKWQYLYIGSVLALVGLASWGLYSVSSVPTPLTYDELLRLWIAKLPVVGALIWLAVHASHEAALAKRLEEDYAYKAAVAACFQGFQERMQEVAKADLPESALAQLCANTLNIIASPPGRIYEKHALNATPSDGVLDKIKSLLSI